MQFFRIVFYYCTVLLLLSETTYVYSKPYELNEFNNETNQMVFNAGKPTNQLIEEEPAIFDISTQVAKFILYFIKKYCKNNDKVNDLQNLLTIKGIGSIFETNAEGKLQPNYEFFENAAPQQIQIESIQPRANVDVDYNHFEMVPNYEIQSATIPIPIPIKQETKHRIEVTTESQSQNIHISKQYQTPQLQSNINNYNYNYMEPESKNIQFKKKPINTQEFVHPTIEKPQSIPSIPPAPAAPVPDFHHQTNFKTGIYKPSKPIIKPEIYEPMYDYISHGDEYGITDTDYDYPMYTTSYNDHIKIKPNPRVYDQPEGYFIKTETTTQDNIIDDWYKYIMPEHKSQNNGQQPRMRQFDQTQQNYDYDSTLPEQEQEQEKAKPAFLDKLIKYISPETEPQQPKDKWYTKYLTEKPVVEQPNNYEQTVPQAQQPKEKWYTKYLTEKPVVEQPNNYEQAQQPKYLQPIEQPKEYPEPQQPVQKEKWYTKYLQPTTTDNPVVLEQPNYYEQTAPQAQQPKEKWYTKYVHPTATDNPEQQPETITKEPTILDKLYKYVKEEPSTEKPGAWDKFIKYIRPEDQPQMRGMSMSMNEEQPRTQQQQFAWAEHQAPVVQDEQQEWYKYINPTQEREKKPLDNWFTVPQQQQPQLHSWLEYEPKLEGPSVIKQEPINWMRAEPNIEMKPKLIEEYSVPHYELTPRAPEGHYEYTIPQHKQPNIQYFENEPIFKQPDIQYFQHEPQMEFFGQQPDFKQPQVQHFGQQQQQQYFEQEQPQIQYFEQGPQIQEHSYDFNMPRMQLEGGEPNILSSSGSSRIPSAPGSPGPSSGWIQYSNGEKPIFGGYNVHQYIMPRTNTPNQRDYWSINQYADDVYNHYSAELQNLDNMKPYYKSAVPSQKYEQFTDNIIKMQDVLHTWQTGGKFYDAPTISNVKNTMSQLSNDAIQLMEPQLQQLEQTTQKAQEDGHSRRTFDGPEKLDKYLEDPENKKEFDSLDLSLQNLIMSYVKIRKEEEQELPKNKQGLLLFLQRIKSQMSKYEKLFSHLKWLDAEIDKLSKNTIINPKFNKYWDQYLILEKYMSLYNVGINSKVMLSLLHVPMTAASSETFKTIIGKLLQDMVDLSDRDPEFNNVKFFLGNEENMEYSPLFQRLKELSQSPKDFLELNGNRGGNSDSKPVRMENRRANSAEEELETETDATEIVATTTEIIEETTTQPTTPTKRIEKHNNVFREYLMTTDEDE